MPGRRSLQEWLSWQERLHPAEIDLGLERVAAVGRRLGVLEPRCPVITVAGTNGKGSSVAFIESVARAHGRSTFAYTSPHLLRYNERMRLNGAEVADASLCAAFEAVERARGDTSLSYFEFGTLAALWLLREHDPDLAVLEVGLGGRLDAVNVVDASVALITPIALDHADWLGDDREQVGREKAGILRPGRPAVCSDPEPPASLLAAAQALEAPLDRIGHDFHVRRAGTGWSLEGTGLVLTDLPPPALPGDFQFANAAGALMALHRAGVRLESGAAAEGLRTARCAGRLQRIAEDPEVIVDVAHNPHAARALADWLEAHPASGPQYAVLGVMADKDIAGILEPLCDRFSVWYAVAPRVARALPADRLAMSLRRQVVGEVVPGGSVAHGLRLARARIVLTGRIVVFGSFYTAAEAMRV